MERKPIATADGDADGDADGSAEGRRHLFITYHGILYVTRSKNSAYI